MKNKGTINSLDKETARQLAHTFVNSSYDVPGDELVILDDDTIEKGYGWVFFYTSRRYLETGDISYMVAGNGPIVIERKDGSITHLGTGQPIEEHLKAYESLRDA